MDTKIKIKVGRWEPFEIEIIKDELRKFFRNRKTYRFHGIYLHCLTIKKHLPQRSWKQIRDKFNRLVKIYGNDKIEF